MARAAEPNDLLYGVAQTGLQVADARAALGARMGEGLIDAAKRVAQERDQARRDVTIHEGYQCDVRAALGEPRDKPGAGMRAIGAIRAALQPADGETVAEAAERVAAERNGKHEIILRLREILGAKKGDSLLAVAQVRMAQAWREPVPEIPALVDAVLKEHHPCVARLPEGAWKKCDGPYAFTTGGPAAGAPIVLPKPRNACETCGTAPAVHYSALARKRLCAACLKANVTAAGEAPYLTTPEEPKPARRGVLSYWLLHRSGLCALPGSGRYGDPARRPWRRRLAYGLAAATALAGAAAAAIQSGAFDALIPK